jgi:hypothetical protein
LKQSPEQSFLEKLSNLDSNVSKGRRMMRFFKEFVGIQNLMNWGKFIIEMKIEIVLVVFENLKKFTTFRLIVIASKKDYSATSLIDGLRLLFWTLYWWNDHFVWLMSVKVIDPKQRIDYKWRALRFWCASSNIIL